MKESLSTKEVCVRVRQDLKRELPGWKFSVTFDSYSGGSSIDLALMSGPEAVCDGTDEGYAQLNHYNFHHPDRSRPYVNNGALLTEQGWKVMKVATNLLDNYHWDESEIQTDYFCCNFYMHVAIGKWDKPYMVKEAK